MASFFFSYARQDSKDAYLKKFYEDLVNEVRTLVGEAEPGFFDTQNIQLGQPWPIELRNALQSTRVMVAVLSKSYIQSQYCGMEWEVFRKRQELLLEGNPAAAAEYILPILWVPSDALPKGLPDVIPPTTFSQQNMGTNYVSEGLRVLSMQNRFHDDYAACVTALARRIHKLVESPQLPQVPDLPELANIKSAFHQTLTPNIDSSQAWSNVGPRNIGFIIVAGKPAELQQFRDMLSAYGESGGEEWCPYMPDINQGAALIAQSVASSPEIGLVAKFWALDNEFITHLENAEKKNQVVVIVVDPWTVGLTNYRDLLSKYDRVNLVNCVVLVPWNPKHDKTMQQRDKLEQQLRQTFPRKMLAKDPNSFLDSISSLEELKKQLAAVVIKAQARIQQVAQVYNRPAGADLIAKPVLSGPGGGG